jgi:hypothetical protein
VSGISIGWTLPALLAGAKTVTRQGWKERGPGRLCAGAVVPIYDRPKAFGGAQIATIRLTADPSFEPLRDMPDSDYEAEGWRWLHDHPEAWGKAIRREDVSWAAFEQWRARPYTIWVIRFELVEVSLPTGVDAAKVEASHA